ncbi:MAG: hypothetical protein U0T73_07155 [Chitinophagales bacterium]
MKKLFTSVLILFAVAAMASESASPGISNLDFSKQIFKVKATIKKVNNNFVLVPDESKNRTFAPVYLPDEYKINGLKVTFDGDIAVTSDPETQLNIRKIWVEYELKEKYRLAHKMYDLN